MIYTFIIEKTKGEINYDFAFHLIQAIKSENWFHNETLYKYRFCSDITKFKPKKSCSYYVPIGSIDFVLQFYKLYLGIIDIVPINIPTQLKKYMFRNTYTKEQLNPEKEYFVKSLDKFKDFTDIVKPSSIPKDKNVFITDVIDIASEWRCFIFNDTLLDVKHYSGDFTKFYDIEIINNMIRDFSTNSPRSYTLDIAVLENGVNAIIEVHQFFSCGLYGFNNYQKLIAMFILTHRDIVNGYRGAQ